MKKHPYLAPEADLLLLAKEDLMIASGEGDGGGSAGGGGTNPENPFWQGGPDIVFPDIPLG